MKRTISFILCNLIVLMLYGQAHVTNWRNTYLRQDSIYTYYDGNFYSKMNTYYSPNGNRIEMRSIWENNQWKEAVLIIEDYNPETNRNTSERYELYRGICEKYAKVVSEYDANGNKIYEENWSVLNNEWVKESMSIYGYGINNRCVRMERYKGKEDEWIKENLYLYQYDTDGKEIQTEYYKGEDDEWIGLAKYIYAYDQNNNKTLEESYNWRDGEWIKHTKYVYVYDSNSNQLLAENYIGKNNVWERHSKFVSEYDNYNSLVFYENFDWKDNAWQSYLKKKYEYEYDARGNVTLRKEYNNYSGVDGDYMYLKAQVKYVYEYDSNHNIILEEKFHKEEGWKDDEWLKLTKMVYAYDKNNNLTLKDSYCRKKNSLSNIWWKEKREVYAYNSKQKETLYEFYIGEDNKWQKSFKHAYYYDRNGNLNKIEYYSAEGTKWIKSSKRETNYNIHSESSVQETYGVTDDKWGNKPSTKTVYHYSYLATAYQFNNRGNAITLDMAFSGTHSLTGSFVLQLPEELELDKANTQLSNSLKNYYQCAITSQKGNCYLFEIKERSAIVVREIGEKPETILTIAYRTKKGVDPGLYNALLKDVDLLVNGSNLSTKELKVEIATNDYRPVDIDDPSLNARAYFSDGILYITTSCDEPINIYTVAGILVSTTRSPSDVLTVSSNSLPKGTLIISGSDWSCVVVNE